MLEERQRRVTTYTTRSSAYGASSGRSAWGYWVPLAFTVTAATVGLVAWIWSERSDDDIETSESEAEHYYASTGSGPGRRNDRPQETGAGMGMAAAGAGLAGAAVGAAAGAAAGYNTMSGGVGSGPNPGPGPNQSSPFGLAQAYPPGGMPPGPQGLGPPAAGGFIAANASMENQQSVGGGFSDGRPQPDQFQGNREITNNATSTENQGFMARMSNAIGINSSQANASTTDGGNWASSAVLAATAAAGAVVGSAVSAVRGSAVDETQHNEQEKWREEIDNPDRTPKQSIARVGTASEFYSGAVEMPRQMAAKQRKRTTVAIVVSAVEHGQGTAEVDAHASILAHLPHHISSFTTRVIVLIYAPDLRTHPLSSIAKRAASTGQSQSRSRSRGNSRAQSTSSSYANINTPLAGDTPAHTPGEFPHDNSSGDDKGILANIDPRPIDSQTSLSRHASRDDEPSSNPLDDASPLYKSLHNQASGLVEKETYILPFTSAQGHKHILRSIGPEIVYIQESLCGRDGEIVSELQGWVRQVVVVIGDEHGAGGLVDSDDEDGRGRKNGNMGGDWWKKEEVTGKGRGVSVVESLMVIEDWKRRVGGEE